MKANLIKLNGIKYRCRFSMIRSGVVMFWLINKVINYYLLKLSFVFFKWVMFVSFSEKRSLASFTNNRDNSLRLPTKFFWFKYILLITSLISKLKDVLENKSIDVHPLITTEKRRSNLNVLWKVLSKLENHQ